MNLSLPQAQPGEDLAVKVVIVEDHELVAQALGAWVKSLAILHLVGMAADGPSGYELCLKERPGLVLLDIELPGMDGLEMALKLRSALPGARLLAMSGRNDAYTIWRALHSGIHGFVDKGQPLDFLLEAVRTVLNGGQFFSAVCMKVQAEWLSRPEAFQKILSGREQDVIRRVVSGQADEEIAIAFGISIATVHVHRRNIRRKLKLHNDREMMRYAQSWGLIPPRVGSI